MQVNVSPPPTHVPPFRQGLDAHVLFFAEGERQEKMQKVPDVQFKRNPIKSRKSPLTRVACAPTPSGWARAAETVSVVITGPSVTARAGITLTFTYTQTSQY